MDGWSGVEAVAASVGAVAGVGGLVVAGLANRRTKQANQLAKAANDLAAEALGKAREANDIAEHANKLSEEANTIARVEAAKQSDPSHVEWRAKWDANAAVVRLTNHGRDVAADVTVLFKRRGVDELVAADKRLARMEALKVPFPEVAQQRAEHVANGERLEREARTAGVIIGRSAFGYSVIFDIRWSSELGNPGQQTVKVRVS